MTTGNLNSDRNNVIVLEDQSLARAYRLEFEEMFSGVFGADKTINTPKRVVTFLEVRQWSFTFHQLMEQTQQ